MMNIDEVIFRGREACRLSNGLIRLVALRGGGHIAELAFEDAPLNPLWQPSWETIDPQNYDPQSHPEYGEVEGKLLSGSRGTCCASTTSARSRKQKRRPTDTSTARLPPPVADSEPRCRCRFCMAGLRRPSAGCGDAANPANHAAEAGERGSFSGRGDQPPAQ